MTRRARVDAELVRRGLARSRQQAAELIGAGRVSIDGMPARQAGHRRRGHRGADRRGRRRTHLGVARRAQAHRRAGRVRDRRVGPPLPRRRRVDRRVHRGAAGPRRRARWSPSTSATASWRGRCGPTRGCACIERTNVRDAAPRRHRRAGRPRRRRPVVHLAGDGAAGADRVRVRRRRYRSHGEAAVRGRQGPGGRRRRGARIPRCAPRRCWRWRAARRELDWHTVGVTASPLPGPSGNVEYFLWLRAT